MGVEKGQTDTVYSFMDSTTQAKIDAVTTAVNSLSTKLDTLATKLDALASKLDQLHTDLQGSIKVVSP